MDESYAAVVMIGVLAIVSFLMGWSRSNETLVYVGHSATAFASLFAVGAGPLWLSIVAGVVFVANLVVLVVRLRRA